MSDALNYLLKTRPQAMKSYFAFLKESGRHLDARTRAIISVITKVDKQTEAGFKQYLGRALREGVSADEILDALLVAFPTLGLTKIIWAVEILLQMDLPEFHPDSLGSQQEWRQVMPISELQEGVISYTTVNERGLLISMDQGEIRVYPAVCPHQGTPLTMEMVQGCELTCPRHQWRFDLRSGECLERGDRPLIPLESRVEQNNLVVYL